jgi:hypothetical protein
MYVHMHSMKDDFWNVYRWIAQAFFFWGGGVISVYDCNLLMTWVFDYKIAALVC